MINTIGQFKPISISSQNNKNDPVISNDSFRYDNNDKNCTYLFLTSSLPNTVVHVQPTLSLFLLTTA